jgi:diguanylate cyclase (GGDEF)-like protein
LKRILIAEDDLISRRLLQKTLEEWGYTVIPADNGQKAWEIFVKEEIKFVIADWMMPEMDGIELCRRIRSLKKSGYVYFIILTGKDRREDIIEGLDAGADDYVAKPLDREELKVRVKAGERIIRLEKELIDKNEALQVLNKRLEELSLIDPLTEIGNRRSFYKTITMAHHRACRYLQGYGVVMCDIDNFKAYNDTYGHLEGDRILKTVADSIKRSLRLSDEAFRYGGEEFVALLQGQDVQGSLVIAERIRRDVESLRIEHKGSESGIVTISCGVESFNEKDKENKWEVILSRADEALYKAKSSGKNRVAAIT